MSTFRVIKRNDNWREIIIDSNEYTFNFESQHTYYNRKDDQDISNNFTDFITSM